MYTFRIRHCLALSATLAIAISSGFAEKPQDKPEAAEAEAPKGKLLHEVRFPDAKGISAFAFTDPAAWRWGFEGGSKYVEHFQKSKYKYPVRSPYNIALVKDAKFGSFTAEFEVMQTGREYGHRDLCFFFGFQDPSHFYYVHIASVSDPHSHNIMIVNGEPRKSITEKGTKGHDWGKDWHRIRVARDLESGKIEIFANDMETPIMVATDKTFGAGWIGFGSFDDTGRVRSIRVYGEDKDKVAEEVPFFKKHGEE